MSYNSKVGSFALNSSTGNQAITGLGFQPKIVLFYTMGDESTTQSLRFGFGAYDGSNQFTNTCNDKTNVTTTAGGTGFSSTSCILQHTPGTVTTQFEAHGVSLDADGFTINITTAATGKTVRYVAFGGDEVSAKVGTGSLPTTVTTQAVTGVGFTPNILMLAHGYDAGSGAGTQTGARFGFGFATAAATNFEFATFGISGNGLSTSANGRCQSAAAIMLACSTAGSVTNTISVNSFDSGGFTLNQTTADGKSRPYGWIVMKAPNARAWWGSGASGTGTFSYPTDATDFYPDTVFFIGTAINAGGGTWPTTATLMDMHYGVSDGTAAGNQFNYSSTSMNGDTTTAAGTQIYAGDCYAFGFPNTPTTWSDEYIGSMTARSSTLAYSINVTATNGSRDFGVLSIGGVQTVKPSGIASSQGFGQPTVAHVGSPQTANPTGIASSQGVGLPAVAARASVHPNGIASSQGIGLPNVHAGPAGIVATGVKTSEGWGRPSAATGPASMHPSGIASSQGFGAPGITTPAVKGLGAGRYRRHKRTYAYNGREYVSLEALHADNPEPEAPREPARAKAKIEPPKRETPQLDALIERLAQPKDDTQAQIDALQAQLSAMADQIGHEQARSRINRELFDAYQAQARDAETYRQQMEDLHRQASEIRIGQMQQQDADDQKAMAAILALVEPDFAPALARG